METILTWIDGAVELYGLRVFEGLATLLVGWFLARVLTGGLRRILQQTGVDPTLGSFVTNLVYITLLTLVVIKALDLFGFPAISFAAVVGAAGLAVGLALKSSLSNFAAGIMLILFRPFQVGDRIEAAGVGGVVTQIQVFSTTVKVSDEKRVIIPNGTIMAGNIANFSAEPAGA